MMPSNTLLSLSFVAMTLMMLTGHVVAQIPADGDLTVYGRMHVDQAKEDAELHRQEVVRDWTSNTKITDLQREEDRLEKLRLIDVGSKTYQDGTIIPYNRKVLVRSKDKREPPGFGDPFWRKAHVQLNMEMDLSAAVMGEAAKDENDVELEVDMTKMRGGVDAAPENLPPLDLSGFVRSSAVVSTDAIYGAKVERLNRNLSVVSEKIFTNATHQNGTFVETTNTTKCKKNLNVEEASCLEEITVYNSFWDAEADPFDEDGYCPGNKCGCAGSAYEEGPKRVVAVSTCNRVCSKGDRMSFIACNYFKTLAHKVEMTVRLTLKESGAKEGKIKRSHPLGEDVRRFMGTF